MIEMDEWSARDVYCGVCGALPGKPCVYDYKLRSPRAGGTSHRRRRQLAAMQAYQAALRKRDLPNGGVYLGG